MKDPIRKNLLDLHYQKYNSAMNTTIIIVFTLLISLIIGVTIGLLTKQLKWDINLQFTVAILGSVTLLVGLFLIRYFHMHIRKIIKALRELRKEELRFDEK